MNKINTKYIIIGIAILIIIIIVIILYFFPLTKKKIASEITTSTTTTTSTTPQSTSTLPNLEGNPPSKEDIKGVDIITKVDTAIDKLPILTNNYAIFYSFNDKKFYANINAVENSNEARTIKAEIEKWFTEQKVDITKIKIQYLFKS